MTLPERELVVTWAGADTGSGVAAYDVEVATDGGAFKPWLAAVSVVERDVCGRTGPHVRVPRHGA